MLDNKKTLYIKVFSTTIISALILLLASCSTDKINNEPNNNTVPTPPSIPTPPDIPEKKSDVPNLENSKFSGSDSAYESENINGQYQRL